MNPKIALAFVILLAALFAVSVGYGLTRGNRQGDSANLDWVEWLGGLLAVEESLTPEDIGPSSPAGCRSQVIQRRITLPPGGQCSFLARERGGRLPRVRAFTLRLEEGATARVVLEQQEQITLKQTLDAETPERKFRVGQAGALVQIQCLSPIGGGCVILRPAGS